MIRMIGVVGGIVVVVTSPDDVCDDGDEDA